MSTASLPSADGLCLNSRFNHDGGYCEADIADRHLSLLISPNVVFGQAKHPVWVAQIDAQLPSAKLSPAERAQVVRLRNKGEREHNAGKHGAAEVSLSRALSMLRK
jgi:hypothetical protein